MDARETVVAARRCAVVVGIGAVLVALGAVDAEPARAADEVVVDDWADLLALSLAGTSPAYVRLAANVTSTGSSGLIVPASGSWVLDLAGHALTVAATSGPALLVENPSDLTIRDTSAGGTGLLELRGATGGAGIGGRFARDAGTVTIEGGTVHAVGVEGGAGIGGGLGGAGGTVTISGGAVTAVGSSYAGGRAAAIGNGALDATPGSLSIAGTRLVGSTDLADAECLAAPSFTGQPGLHARVDVSTTPECSVTVQLGSGELPQVTPTSLGAARVGEPFDALVAATGDPAPAFSVTAGALPPGLALHPTTGRITGTPTTAGTFTAMVTAANQILGLPQAHSLSVSLTVAAAPPPPPDPADPEDSGGSGPGGAGPGAADPAGPGHGSGPGSPGDGGTAPGGSGPGGNGRDGSGPGGSDGGTGPGASGPSDGGAGALGSDGRGAAGVGSSGTRTWKAPGALGNTGSEPAPMLATALALLVGGASARAVVVARRHARCASD